MFHANNTHVLKYMVFLIDQIPGRWQVFIDQLQSSAQEDCAAFYESDVSLLLIKYENSAVNETELLVCELC